MKRRDAREIAFKLTYEMVMTGDYNTETRDDLLENGDCDSVNYINSAISGIKEHYDELKALIVKYELKYTDTPHAVVVNEAVELAKLYSDTRSHTFINGILASVIKEDTNG